MTDGRARYIDSGKRNMTNDPTTEVCKLLPSLSLCLCVCLSVCVCPTISYQLTIGCELPTPASLANSAYTSDTVSRSAILLPARSVSFFSLISPRELTTSNQLTLVSMRWWTAHLLNDPMTGFSVVSGVEGVGCAEEQCPCQEFLRILRPATPRTNGLSSIDACSLPSSRTVRNQYTQQGC